MLRAEMGSVLALTVLAGMLSCGDQRFSWAYAEERDGSIRPSEYCRRSLADVLYQKESQPRLSGSGNRRLFSINENGSAYFIVAFNSESACAAALSVARTVGTREGRR
jgi:hypothetical protein